MKFSSRKLSVKMEVRGTLDGVSALQAKLKATPLAVRTASQAATIDGSKVLVSEVRSNIRGEPRWGHRGKSRIYHESITVSNARGNGGGEFPGTLSGDLLKGVGYKKQPIVTGSVVTGGVGIGKVVNNLKKKYLEENWPFFAPAVATATPDIIAAYAAAWTAAIQSTMGA